MRKIKVKFVSHSDTFNSSTFIRAILWTVLGFQSAASESFSPLFGPVSGGTVLTLNGLKSISGSVDRIVVAGSECELYNRTIPTCRTRKSANVTSHCGVVEVTTDNRTQKFSTSMFCYKPDPSILSITPAATIQSGGTVLNISGFNFNSTNFYVLVINYTDGYSEKGQCFSETITQGGVMCKTPNVAYMTEPYFRLAHSSDQVEAFASLVRDNVSLVNVKPISLTIHRDPTFNIPESYHHSDQQQLLILMGKHIPTFINTTDIHVSLGLSSCPVLLITKDYLVCNTAGAMEHFENEINAFLNFSEQESTKSSRQEYFNHTNGPQYRVVVQIGNYYQDLGHIRVTLSSPGIITPSTFNRFKLVTMTASICLAVAAVLITTLAMVRLRKTTATKIQECQEVIVQIVDAEFKKDQGEDWDQLNIPFEKISIGKHIGLGTFGRVYEGILNLGSGFTRKIAVKTLRDPMTSDVDHKKFLKEAFIMKDFRHPNVLEVIGLTEETLGVYHVILPLMDNGDLLSHIRDFMVTLSVQDVYNFGSGIASGMAYLSSLKFVHRDLAARNCMLDEDYCIKIADFGLCRDIYEKGYYKTEGNVVMPLRWMAIESIQTGHYTTKSDVWSFGVVLWEMLTRGMTPYPCVNDQDIVRFLKNSRLAAPFFCPDSLYNLMMRCWEENPNRRPGFDTIQRELSQKFTTKTAIPVLSLESKRMSYVNLSLDKQYSGSVMYQNLTLLGKDTGPGTLEPEVNPVTGTANVTQDVIIKYPSCMSFRHSNVQQAGCNYTTLKKERTSNNDYMFLNISSDS